MDTTKEKEPKYKTTEERAKQILELRKQKLKAQNDLSTVNEKLAKPRAELALAKSPIEKQLEDLDEGFTAANENDLKKAAEFETDMTDAEVEIRELVIEEYLSRSVKEKESKIVFPDLQVTVKKTRSIDPAYTHDDILAVVQEKYPTLLTYNADKLIKQSEIYDVVDVPNPVRDLEDRVVGPATIPGIKEMPYIVLHEKVGATIKSKFWEGGDEDEVE